MEGKLIILKAENKDFTNDKGTLIKYARAECMIGGRVVKLSIDPELVDRANEVKEQEIKVALEFSEAFNKLKVKIVGIK